MQRLLVSNVLSTALICSGCFTPGRRNLPAGWNAGDPADMFGYTIPGLRVVKGQLTQYSSCPRLSKNSAPDFSISLCRTETAKGDIDEIGFGPTRVWYRSNTEAEIPYFLLAYVGLGVSYVAAEYEPPPFTKHSSAGIYVHCGASVSGFFAGASGSGFFAGLLGVGCELRYTVGTDLDFGVPGAPDSVDGLQVALLVNFIF